jgi:predicted nucleic acid-binding protein
MIIVSDTPPIRYLVEIEKAYILQELFGRVIMPKAVYNDMQREKTPQKVREWVVNHPDWLEVRDADTSVFTPRKKIGAGEREAFALAIEIKADAVLTDDYGAMVEARRNNITTIPTFTILEWAAAKNLINLEEAVDQMRGTSFRLPLEEDIQAMLERDRQRKLTGQQEQSPAPPAEGQAQYEE